MNIPRTRRYPKRPFDTQRKVEPDKARRFDERDAPWLMIPSQWTWQIIPNAVDTTGWPPL